MTLSADSTIDIIVPCGALGLGVKESDIFDAVARGAHAIACDAGSTDSGPAYLATAKCKYSRDSIKHDLSILMRAQAQAQIPLLIGSCGTSGCDEALKWTAEIALEIALEHDLHPRIALLESEQSPKQMADLARANRIRPLAPMDDVAPERFEACEHIVALMGPEPYIAALKAGADIVLGGRTTDTAVLAAVPLMMGAGLGAAWHAGKIAECGSLCTELPREGGVMIRVGLDHFTVEPLGAHNRCTVTTVSSHMLYENSDPFVLYEPGGYLDATHARYQSVDERIVRVSGAQFVTQPYTMKLEGARGGGFQTMMLVGIEDRDVLTDIDRFLAHMHQVLVELVHKNMGTRAGQFHISLRPYGWNAVSGIPPRDPSVKPREIGLLFVVTASSQEIATQIAKTCNPWFFHLPVKAGQELPSYAFPFSPAEVEVGQVFEFMLNHVVQVDHPQELVRTSWLSTDVAVGVTHG
jgi:hypothetical protein